MIESPTEEKKNRLGPTWGRERKINYIPITLVILVQKLISYKIIFRCIRFLEKQELDEAGQYAGVDAHSDSEMLTPASETSSLVHPK